MRDRVICLSKVFYCRRSVVTSRTGYFSCDVLRMGKVRAEDTADFVYRQWLQSSRFDPFRLGVIRCDRATITISLQPAGFETRLSWRVFWTRSCKSIGWRYIFRALSCRASEIPAETSPNDGSWQDSHRAILAAQHTVQIECGADQGEVCKGLRKIAQRLAFPVCSA
jgi:hypothetical protein